MLVVILHNGVEDGGGDISFGACGFGYFASSVDGGGFDCVEDVFGEAFLDFFDFEWGWLMGMIKGVG